MVSCREPGRVSGVSDQGRLDRAVMRSLEGMLLDHVKLDVSIVRRLGTNSARSLLIGIVSSVHQLEFAVSAKNTEANPS